MKSSLLIALFVLVGCGGDAGFTGNHNGGTEEQGNGRIELSDKALQFDDLQVEFASTKYLKITSTGDNDLVVYKVRILDSGNGVFFTEGVEDLTLAPTESEEIAVVATLHEDAAAEGSLRIECNDPDQLKIEVALLGTPGKAVDTGDSGDSGK